MYCFIKDSFKTIGRKEAVHCKLTDAELLTTALITAPYLYGNLPNACELDACEYMQENHGVKMIDKPGFIRQLHKPRQQLTFLFLTLGNTLKELNTFCYYLIYSFPVAVYDNIRISRGRVLQGKLNAK